MNDDRLHAMFRVVATLHHGEEEAFVSACVGFRDAFDPERVLLTDLLRVCHLFYGFPRVVRATTLLAQQIGFVTPEVAVAFPEDRLAAGEAAFREVYGRDADPVLAHLERVDPTYRSWVLAHAYGTTFATTRLSLEERERISVLALSASGCWQQARSHMRACLRHGVHAETLLADLSAVAWLDQEALDLATTCIHAEAQLG